MMRLMGWRHLGGLTGSALGIVVPATSAVGEVQSMAPTMIVGLCVGAAIGWLIGDRFDAS
jgi:F0F1-type ATP synthase assembly protein I